MFKTRRRLYLNENYTIDLVSALDQKRSQKQLNSDIKQIEKMLNFLQLTGTFSKTTPKKLNTYIKQLSAQLSTIKLKAEIDTKNIKSDISKALNNVSFKDIDALNINENKSKIKFQKVVADAKSFAEKNPISIGINYENRRNKLDNDLTAYLNRNSKINESSVLLKESNKVRELISTINDKKSLSEATDSFRLFKSEVASTGYNSKSTSDKIKSMLRHVTKISSVFGVASVAVNSFTKSISELKEIDTLLTEISKANDKLSKSDLIKIGNDSFGIASQYGKKATNYLSGVQEASRAGYENAEAIAQLSVAAQGAGDMTDTLANKYLIATDKAYKFGGSVEKLTEVLDGSNYITNHNAVNMTELAESMSIVGSTAASFGVDVDETTAALGTMIATTQQSGSEVARAFKAILLNIRQVSDEEEGIDAEGLTKYEKACNALNVKLKETKNGVLSLRDPMEVLKELSVEYNKLEESDVRRTDLLSSIGGKLRSTQLDALLRQWDTYESMLQQYAEGTGSMAAEAEKTAKSWEGHLNSLSNSFTSFVNTVTSKDAVLGGIGFLDKMIQGAESFVDTFGTIPTVLTAINSSMVAMQKDYGITQLINPETKKFDVQGSIFGINFTAIKNQKKHFEEAGNAISGWNSKLNQGQTDINKFENTLISNNTQLKEYLSTCSKDAPASLNGYKNYLQQTGQATEDLRLKTILLNAALTLLGSIAIQAVITGIVQAFDKFNETVVESKEKVDDINSKISDLKSQIEELNNLEYKSDFDNQKISQLERELELQEKILEIEQKRLYQNQIGTKFSDYFDKDSLVTKQNAEYDRNNKEGFSNLSRAFKTYESSLNDIDSELTSLQEKLNSENLIGHDRFMTEGKIAKLTEKRNDLLEKQQTIEDQLTLNMGEYLKNWQTAQEAVESGLLTGSDLEKAESMAEYWDSLYKDSLGIVTNIQKMGGRYDNTNDLLEEKFGNISRDDLVSLSDDDKRIALSFDPDNIIGFEELKQRIEETKGNIEELNDTPVTFNISDHNEAIDNIRSTLSTLREALNAFNSGTMDESMVLNLMQKFPELIPYIDLAADGFGNLSEGLSVLIAQQPDSLIQSLQTLKESLNTEEERAQVDALINSLQSLSSYGDTGMEAYATAIGSTWTDTANVIQSVTDQFENLAKVQEAVADGLTISTSAAAELAKIYPEILTNAEYAGNGQIQLNEEVVKSILAGDQSIINAQITKLEADKAELEAKKSYAEAQLEMIKQVAEGEGNITKEVAQYRLDIANALLQALIEAGMEEDKAYAAVAANMAGNMDEFNRIVGEVAQDTSVNMDNAAVSMANSININAINAQNSFKAMQQSVWSLAESIRAAASGERAGSTINPSGGGSTSGKNIVSDIHSGNFGTTLTEYTPKSIDFSEFQSQLKIDISAYEKAISNIDSQIEVLKNLQSTFVDTVDSANGGIGDHNYADKIKDLEKEKDKINKSLDDAKSGSGSSKETKDEYEELFNFFERRVKVLDNALSLLKTNLDNVTGSFAKNNLIDAELGITEEKFKNYSDALNMYTQKANEALSKLPSDIAAKVKDGAIDLTTFIGDGNKEVVEAIKDYEQWADKVADCKQELAELRTAIRQLELEKFNNIMEEFSNQFDLREDGKDLISKQIDLLKEAGQLIGESFFTTQIEQSKKQLALLEAEKTKLVEQMTSAVSSGRVQKGTDEWLSMVNTLSDVEGNILDCKKAIEEFDNELLQLHWDIFDRIQTQFSNISSELGNLAGLFDDFNDIRVSDGKGTWTKQAIATLGLYAQQYELAKYQVEQYNEAIDKLNEDYKNGKYSATEYMDKLADLSKEQWNCVESAESMEDSIVSLNKIRVNEEIEVIEDLIDAYKKYTDSAVKALEAEKDLREYQDQIAKKSKSITDLEKRLAAMQNDNTAATVAKRKQLEEQLAKAREDLEDAEYDHSIEAQENALNKQYDDYKSERDKEIEALKASLEERETLIAQSFETVKANADLVGQEIAYIATQHGITVSDAIITSWQNGEQAIASYGDVLSAGTSAFIGNIMGVENEVYNLQAQANSTADSLAWMFSTRADNLVNELASSYYSEENLNYMTQALHDSLVNTLEGGYNISSIQSALDGIASGLNNVASAANNATSAMAAMGAAQERASMGAAQQTGSSNTGKVVGGYSIHQVGAVDPTYTVRDGLGNIVSSGNTLKQAQDYLKNKHVNGYASGTRNAKGGIRVVDEEGKELILPKLQSGRYTIGNEGDQIFTKEQTNRLYNLSNVDFDEFRKKLTDASPSMLSWNIPDSVRQHNPEMVSNNINKNNDVNMHYDSLITINGDVNDTKHFLNDIKTVANDAIKQSWHDFEMTRKYGSY